MVPAPGGGTPTRAQAAGQQKYFPLRSASHLLLALAVLQGQVLARAVGTQAAAAAAQQEVPLERDQGQVRLRGGAGQGGWDVRGGEGAARGAGRAQSGLARRCAGVGAWRRRPLPQRNMHPGVAQRLQARPAQGSAAAPAGNPARLRAACHTVT